MRLTRFVLLILIWPAMAFASGWEHLTGDQIRTALEDRQLVYDTGATQEFQPSGRTLYTTADQRWGYWGVQGDQYCSRWPPADEWKCWDVHTNGVKVRFVEASGHAVVGTYVK